MVTQISWFASRPVRRARLKNAVASSYCVLDSKLVKLNLTNGSADAASVQLNRWFEVWIGNCRLCDDRYMSSLRGQNRQVHWVKSLIYGQGVWNQRHTVDFIEWFICPVRRPICRQKRWIMATRTSPLLNQLASFLAWMYPGVAPDLVHNELSNTDVSVFDASTVFWFRWSSLKVEIALRVKASFACWTFCSATTLEFPSSSLLRKQKLSRA